MSLFQKPEILIGRFLAFLKNRRAYVLFNGNVMLHAIISQKGVYAYPKDKEPCLILPLGNTQKNGAIMAIQNYVPDLQPGDVMLTDDESTIYFQPTESSVTITTRSLIVDGKELSITGENGIIRIKNLKIECENIEFISKTLKHNGVNIGSTHIHIADGKPTTVAK